MSDFESLELVGDCVNMTIPQNSTETIDIEYRVDGDLTDLTGSTLKWFVAESRGSDTFVIEASSDETTGSFITILDQVDFIGKAIITIAASDTIGMPFDKGYPHGLVKIDGEPEQLFGGTFKLSYTVPR
ncbi:hypothetical protein CL634_06980 [bacterium]|nr:hypothetical protein [bacterium]